MPKYAEIRHNKIVTIYNDQRSFDDFCKVMKNGSVIMDVSDIPCDIGWSLTQEENTNVLRLTPSDDTEVKNNQINSNAREKIDIQYKIHSDLSMIDLYCLIADMNEKINKIIQKQKGE